ncbi:MAG: hypothetical protein ACYTFG_13860 [Planctomycetota bacterium]
MSSFDVLSRITRHLPTKPASEIEPGDVLVETEPTYQAIRVDKVNHVGFEVEITVEDDVLVSHADEPYVYWPDHGD